MQREHLKVIANTRHKLYFAYFLGQSSFFKQQHKQMMPEPLPYGSCQTKSSLQENSLNGAPVHQIDIPMNVNSVITGSFIGRPF